MWEAILFFVCLGTLLGMVELHARFHKNHE